jgi:DNA-directed RNA polymerase beta subunit
MKCIKEMIDNKTTREDFDFLETLGDILHNLGFTRDCTRSFIDGRTGKRIPNTMFFATHAMYQLKHRGEKKLRARGTGHKDPITHLPVSKKAKNGGLKLGEQERATLTSNGAAEIVKERLFVSADGTFAYICRFCHTIGFSPHTEVKRTVCWRCSMFNSGDVNEIPHVAKLMEGYLRSMCIATKFYCKRVDKTRLVDAFKHKYGDKQMS